MKNEQQQQAKHLYFQSALNKSQIADLIGVNRRTVMLWVQQGNWDRLKMSSMHMPSMVVEKCYYVLNHYLDNLMAANNTISTFGPKEAAAINQMATAIKKINNRSAVNESMELLSFFLDDVRKKDPAMADAIMPFAEQYIAKRSKTNLADLLPKDFNDQGYHNPSDDDIMEQWLDEQEYAKMEREAAEAAGAVIPQEEEVLIKSFRDNCEETRVMRPVKGSAAPKDDTNDGTDNDVPGDGPVPVPGNPGSPSVVSSSVVSSSNDTQRPRTLEEIALAELQTSNERRKLLEDIQKHLDEILTLHATQNSAAA